MTKIATREAYGKALAKLVKNNESIFVLDADLSKSTKTADAKEICPNQHINVGIAEGNMMSVAAGLASCGNTVFASTFAVFASGRGFEQIRNSICYPNLNVKVCATHAGITVGEDGASHQSIEDIALMRSLPNMTVISPCDAIETELAIEAVSKINTPCYVRLGRLPVASVNKENYKFELGKGSILQEGDDITIFATGFMVQQVIEASKILKNDGINLTVVNIHTIKPIDEELIINLAKKSKIIFTCEEHSIIGGLGSAVCEVVSKNHPTKICTIGINDTFGESGTPMSLIEKYNLSASAIVSTIKSYL